MNHLEIVDELRKIIKSNNNDSWMTLKEAYSYTKLSQSTLFRAISLGQLKVSKQTGKHLFKKIWIDRYLFNE